MIQSGLQQRSTDSCFTFAKIKVFTFKTNCKMTSIKARLNCSRLGKDGLYPLVIQVIHNRIKREMYTPYRLKRTEFDPHTEKALTDRRSKTRATEIREINEYLIYIKEELEKVCHSLARRGEFTSGDVIAGYRARNDMSNFFIYADYRISELIRAGKNGTAANYRSAVNAFGHFVGSRDLSLNAITKKTIEAFIDSRGVLKNNPNTIHFYVKQLRAIYNKADDEGYVHAVYNPFHKIRLKGSKSPKRAISKSEVGKIAALELEGEHAHKALARDLFLFSIYTRGMSFVDMCYLRKENIFGNMLVYRRRKTDQLLQVKIEPPLKALLRKYGDNSSPYLLPMLRSDDSYKGYRYIQRRLNKRIRELGDRLGFDFPLTFYVARHTWATFAHEKGVPVSVISESMGHTSEKTTHLYLASLSHKVIDKANKAVINYWTSGKRV